jgi:MYXO-CTERM domain-containing protein
MSTQEQRLLGPLAMRYAAMILLAAAPLAHAQFNVTVTALGTRDATTAQLSQLATMQLSPIGIEECQNASITLQFTGVDTTRQSLKFWYGTDCMTVTNRTNDNLTACEPLSASPVSINNSMTLTATIPVSQLSSVSCATAQENLQTTFVLALNNDGDMVAANQIKSFPIAFDLQAPSVPTGVLDSAGDPTATVNWTASSGATAATVRYEVYVDPGGCVDGTASANMFMAGSAPPDGLTPLITTTPTATIDFANYGTPTDGYVAVAVRAVDRGNNASVLSNIACIQHVQVQTWWATYCARTPQPSACASTGCSVHATRPDSSQASLIAPLALGALLIARRRRR